MAVCQTMVLTAMVAKISPVVIVASGSTRLVVVMTRMYLGKFLATQITEYLPKIMGIFLDLTLSFSSVVTFITLPQIHSKDYCTKLHTLSGQYSGKQVLAMENSRLSTHLMLSGAGISDDDEPIKSDEVWITNLASSGCLADKAPEFRKILLEP